MGLVSTWLNGIGLRSVVPTFEAAGIVSPSHLADLDVSYFESLGVTDPDDRRKLFYLVQRIKLAVSNKKDSSSKNVISAEERVDAVISDFGDEDEENTKHNNYFKGGNDDKLTAKEPSKHTNSEEKKVEREPVRRSNRIIAKKKKNIKVNAKENKEIGTQNLSPAVSAASRKTSNVSTTNKSTSTQRKAKKEAVTGPPSTPSKRSPVKKSSSKSAKERMEKIPSRTQSLTSKSAIPPATSSLNSSSEDENVDEGDDLNNQTNSNDRITRGTAQMLHTTDMSGGIRNHFSRRQKPESKLPVSARASKRLSTASTQKITPQTSKGQSSSSLPNIHIDETRTTSLNARRVTLAPNFGSLGNFGQSSASPGKHRANAKIELTGGSVHSVSDAEANSTRDRSGNLPRFTTNNRSSKSMSVSESALLQQYQRNHQKRSSMSSTFSVQNPSPAATTKPVLSSKSDRMTRTAPTSSNRNLSVPPPSTPVITHATGQAAESWATKIEFLREDNNAEHELFQDQVEDESRYHEYYDMRIKVIVRKRPLSKSESLTGGVDIVHPLDYGSYGKTLVYQPKTRVDLTKEVETVPFAFDNVFNESSTNIGIYNRSLRNLVEPFFKGQWATVFAYGQTGSGYGKNSFFH
jgi:hypothetical protein